MSEVRCGIFFSENLKKNNKIINTLKEGIEPAVTEPITGYTPGPSSATTA